VRLTCGGAFAARVARRAALAAALSLGAAAARADGLGFVGDTPNAPHVMLDLTDAQRETIARFSGQGSHRSPEIRLTAEQREVLRRETGQDVPWVFAATRQSLEGDCGCGVYNLGVLVGDRLAVLQLDLGDHLSPDELEATAQALTDVSLRSTPPDPVPVVSDHGPTDGDDAPVALRSIAAVFPGGSFDRALALRGRWRAARLRLAAMPRLAEGEGRVDVALLLADSAVAWTPAEGNVIRWPDLGARLEEGGRVYYLVPGAGEAELGPAERVWFLLEYREGRLVAAVARSSHGWAGATFDPPSRASDR
jgi:hypothetical protein